MRLLKGAIMLFVLALCTICKAQGLRFTGSEASINERTSFNLSHGKLMSSSDSLALEFDFRIFSGSQSGYVLHLDTAPGTDAPVIDLFYEETSEAHDFGVIWEGTRYVVKMDIPKGEQRSKWQRLRLALFPAMDSVALSIAGHSAGGSIDLPSRIRPNICFGKSDYLIDVPSFAIRNLSIRTDARIISFPLQEDSGNIARSTRKRIWGKVANPVWLVNDSYYWKEEGRFSSKTFLSAGYDDSRNSVYVFNRDSIIFLNIENLSISATSFAQKCPVDIFLGTSFIDQRTGDIYSYEVYYDDGLRQAGATSVARLDRETLVWSPLSSDVLDMQMHHHDEYLDTAGRRFIIFGGFGNRRYNGDFYSFSLDSLKWSRLPAQKGDAIWPRYFSSLGYDSVRDKIYIFGGMGNKSGDQVVGRRYFYDLHEVSLSTGRCRKLWDIPWESPNCVSVRNMIVSPEEDCFYAVCYPESVTESQLFVYKFSIEDGAFQKLANPVPIFSDKITTNANLYMDKSLEKLILIVEESHDDISSEVSVYTINFPPKTAGIPTVMRERIVGMIKYGIAGLVLILMLSVLVRRIYHKKKLKARIPEYVNQAEPQENAVMLFGQFSAKDRFGNDISEQFTSKLKQLLCLVLQYRDGLTSKRISLLLWPEKEEDESKNVRGVTISNLRKILREIEGVSFVFSEGKFSLQASDAFYCDYLEMLDIINAEKPDMDKFIGLLSRGAFLKSESDPFYDKFKSSVEQRIAPIMQVEIARRFELRQYLTCVTCAEILFGIDPFNDEALYYAVRAYKNVQREDAAAEIYHSFAVRYKNDYGQEYPKSFDEIK